MKVKALLIALSFFLRFAVTFGQPFIDDIKRFKEMDSQTPPPTDAVLFIGSSSFTMWYDVKDYFSDFTIINRGFGGSTLEDQIRYVGQIVYPYSPRQIVIYCGENDFATIDTLGVETVTRRFVTLFDSIRHEMPHVPISYISMKPSPLRWSLAHKFMAANAAIEKFLGTQPHTSYINVWDSMLGADSIPNKDIFLDDMLHINAKGYAIWQKLIEPHLIQ